MMIDGMPGDPIRLLTVLVCLTTCILALRDIVLRRGFMPRRVFVSVWCAHVVVFYCAYILTGRWAGEFAELRAWWPPVIVTHAALSSFALQLWNYFTGGKRGD